MELTNHNIELVGDTIQNQNANLDTAPHKMFHKDQKDQTGGRTPSDRFAFFMNNKIEDAKSWDDAKNIEKEKWINETLDEMNSLRANDTWELAEALPGIRVIC